MQFTFAIILLSNNSTGDDLQKYDELFSVNL